MFEQYRSRRVAILVAGKPEERKETVENLEKEEWVICDLDAFYDNLTMWNGNSKTTLECVNLLFSDPTPGIKQHLANAQERNVAVVGNKLSDPETSQLIAFEYNRRGYDVMAVTYRTLRGQVRETTEYIPGNQQVYVEYKARKR